MGAIRIRGTDGRIVCRNPVCCGDMFKLAGESSSPVAKCVLCDADMGPIEALRAAADNLPHTPINARVVLVTSPKPGAQRAGRAEPIHSVNKIGRSSPP
jgi:hypothetical protein